MDSCHDALSRRLRAIVLKTTDCCGSENEIRLKSSLVSIAVSNSTESTAGAVSKGDSGSSSKVAIRVGVGVPLGILAISMLGFGFWWGKKKARVESQALRDQFQSQMRDLQNRTSATIFKADT